MLSPNDVILLLEKWTRRLFAVDVRQTDLKEYFMPDFTVTDKVRHISEIDVTTDVCLDSMTVQAQTPPSNTVNVIPGKIQWFEQIIEVTDTIESPVLPPFTTKDCDPLITEPVRWSLLCMKQDTQGNDVLFWEHGVPGMGYPEVPHLGVPLALVKTTIGLVQIDQTDIINWRSIRPGYAPGAKYQYPPVTDPDELYKYEDPVEGAQCLVLSAGNYYYYKDGEWHTTGMPSFDNTAWYRDITAATTRIDLPWPIKSRVEILVFRDGQLMLLGRDYLVMVGAASYIQFNHLLLPGQRIVVLRNPFMSQAFSGSGSNAVGTETVDVYVDGEIGNDAWEGSDINPFKTLQRAFDSVPLYSMRIYTIHAKNLKLADKVTVEGSDDKVFGYARGKKLVALILDIDDSYEWDSSMSAVATLYACNYVVFGSGELKYRLDLVQSMAGFVDTEITTSLVIWGGYTTMVGVVSNTGEANKTVFTAGAAGKLNGCTMRYVEVSDSSYISMTTCTIYNLLGYNNGVLQMIYGFLNESVSIANATLQLSNVRIRAKGEFLHSYVAAGSCDNTGEFGFSVPLFFNGTQGSTFNLTGTRISYTDGYGIKLAHGSTLYMDGGSVDRASRDGILVSFNSSAFLSGVRISANGDAGVRGDYNASIYFEACSGGDNGRWGCECYNLSRASFTSLVVWGMLGGYYEQIPGSDTVVSKLGVDMSPGALDDKIVVGKGLKVSVQPGTTTGDYKFHINIDTATLAGPGSSYVINTSSRQNVLTRYSPVLATSPDTDMQVRWSGQGYMSSVCQRIYDPTTRRKVVLTNAAMRSEFVEMDETVGTDFLTSGVTLHDDPLLGYPAPDKPYYFMTNPDGMGVITVYGTQYVSNFSMEADVPAGTEVRVAFSTSGANLWMKWNPSMMSWDLLPGESTLIQMQNAPLHTTVATWNPACWDLLRLVGGQCLCVCFLLSSSSATLTPKVKSFTWDYVEDGFLLDITHAFSRKYFNNRAIFTYDGSLGAQIDPPIVFSVMPTADREA